jgi:hypothetical protein
MNWKRGFRRLEIVLLVIFTGFGGICGFSFRGKDKIDELKYQLWNEQNKKDNVCTNEQRQRLLDAGFTEKEISDYYSEAEKAKRIKTLETKIKQEESRYFHRILFSLPPVLKGGLVGYLFIWIPWTILAWIIKGFSDSK